jgi:hypothetical protein
MTLYQLLMWVTHGIRQHFDGNRQVSIGKDRKISPALKHPKLDCAPFATVNA